MTISTRIRGEVFTSQSGDKNLCDFMEAPLGPPLIRLPTSQPPQNVEGTCNKKKIAMKTTKVIAEQVVVPEIREKSQCHGVPWTKDEHDRFLQGLELFPSGPWKYVASYVGTRTPRQTMTHAQKHRQKIQRQERKYFMESLAQPVPMTPVAYDGFVVPTNVKDQAFQQSPKAVDRRLDINEQAVPLQNNGDDKVELGELSPSFQAFCELYGYAVFPRDDEKPVNGVNCDFPRTESTML
ncbi:unnamed protein product [Peronospora farinosa]|uniref:HTH myb-type domain-containing protein n=1 Tax=Peronospora farinosa TaxID=134698 RepID=A0AAV0TI58_9STRA|nr:unnamed protein product [Peronospora farinosa]